MSRLLRFDPALVGAGNSHVLAILGDGATRHTIAHIAQTMGNLLVGQGVHGFFFLDHFLHQPFQIDQRSEVASRSLDGLGKEITKFVNALGGMRVLIGDGAADGGGMHAHFFRHFLDHHGPQLVDALVEEFFLAADDRLRKHG